MADKYGRPATLEDLKLLARALNEQKTDYLLIGGFALNAHGYTRATVDIDILVPGTEETGEKVKKALLVLPEHAAKDIDPSWFKEREAIRVGDAFTVDILFNAAGKTYEDLREYSQTIVLDGVSIKTVNLEGLLLTKQTVRDKDKVDQAVIRESLRLKGLDSV